MQHDADAGAQAEKDRLYHEARHFLESLPHAQALQMRIDDMGSGRAVISMPWQEKLVGDPDRGVVHGGVVTALMDTCSGIAVYSRLRRLRAMATLDLRIDYMRPAGPKQRITAMAECYHVTPSVAFVRVHAQDETPDSPVATGLGTFTVEHGDR